MLDLKCFNECMGSNIIDYALMYRLIVFFIILESITSVNDLQEKIGSTISTAFRCVQIKRLL